MEDKTIKCKDCGKEFVFSVGEQEFYKEKGFTNDPVRCPECRRAKKEQNRRYLNYYIKVPCDLYIFINIYMLMYKNVKLNFYFNKFH